MYTDFTAFDNLLLTSHTALSENSLLSEDFNILIVFSISFALFEIHV